MTDRSGGQMIVIRADAFTLKCACHGLPFAYIQDGMLIIQSKHHGDKCVSVVPLVNVESFTFDKVTMRQ